MNNAPMESIFFVIYKTYAVNSIQSKIKLVIFLTNFDDCIMHWSQCLGWFYVQYYVYIS